jgi:ubiquinone/menaquinone biosynthesis C-methylase UbiE
MICEKKKKKRQSNIHFKIMSLFFKFRDKSKPPILKIQKAGIKQGDIVLDYRCGPGSYTIAATELLGPSGRVYAADIHPLAIKKVIKDASKRELKNIESFQTNCKLDIREASVDVVMYFDTFHNLEDYECNLKEFNRVLKANSILIVDDHHYSEEEIIKKVADQGLFKLKEKKDDQYLFIKK